MLMKIAENSITLSNAFISTCSIIKVIILDHGQSDMEAPCVCVCNIQLNSPPYCFSIYPLYLHYYTTNQILATSQCSFEQSIITCHTVHNKIVQSYIHLAFLLGCVCFGTLIATSSMHRES